MQFLVRVNGTNLVVPVTLELSRLSSTGFRGKTVLTGGLRLSTCETKQFAVVFRICQGCHPVFQFEINCTEVYKSSLQVSSC